MLRQFWRLYNAIKGEMRNATANAANFEPPYCLYYHLHGDAKTPLLAGKFFESPYFSRSSTSPVLKIKRWVEVFSFLMAM